MNWLSWWCSCLSSAPTREPLRLGGDSEWATMNDTSNIGATQTGSRGERGVRSLWHVDYVDRNILLPLTNSVLCYLKLLSGPFTGMKYTLVHLTAKWNISNFSERLKFKSLTLTTTWKFKNGCYVTNFTHVHKKKKRRPLFSSSEVTASTFAKGILHFYSSDREMLFKFNLSPS